jgi:hypothetical protein
MTTPFWLYNPNILFKSDQIYNIWPSSQMSFDAKLNAMTRLVTLLTVLGYLLTKNIKIVLSGLVTLGAIILLFFIRKNNGKKEGYSNAELYSILKDDYTEPSVKNPMMNVLLTEIADNPRRKEAAPAFNPIVEADLNEKTKQFIANNFDDPAIDERLFNDLGDNFTFEQSMRAWNPMPSTTIPNDQKAFTDYCFGDMIACRDDNNNELACVRNSPPRWTNH